MRLERAAKFGVFGSIGFILISLGMYVMIREIQTGVEAGTVEGNAAILIILIGGTAAGMILLFTLIGEYVDRELADRGLANSEA